MQRGRNMIATRGKTRSRMRQSAPAARGRMRVGIELRRARLASALSQITENRKVEAPKPLIFRDPIFGFCLQKATLRQSRSLHQERRDTTCCNHADARPPDPHRGATHCSDVPRGYAGAGGPLEPCETLPRDRKLATKCTVCGVRLQRILPLYDAADACRAEREECQPCPSPSVVMP